jgi:hypothetical protein
MHCHEQVTLVALQGARDLQIGWAAWPPSFSPKKASGVGDDEASWAADGLRRTLFHGGALSRASFGTSWHEGDVISVAADLQRGAISFARNGEWAECYSGVDAAQLFPAVSSGPGALFRVNLGAEPLVHPSPDPHQCAPLLRDGDGGMAPLRGSMLSGGDMIPSRHVRRLPEGTGALHLACFRGHEENVRAIVAARASVDQPNCAGATPLALACAGGHASVAHYLLEAAPAETAAQVELARVLARERGHAELAAALP